MEELHVSANFSALQADEPPAEVTLMIGILSFILTFIGVLVNVLAILTLCCDHHIRTQSTTTFVLSQAVSDLLFCVITIPVTAASNLARRMITSLEVCVGITYFSYVFLSVSLTSMAAITINRYVKVVYNSWYSRIYTRYRICGMICMVWIFSFLLYMPPLIQVWGRISRPKEDYTCKIIKDPDTGSPKAFIMLVGAILPSITIICSYSHIYYTVRQVNRNLIAHSIRRPNNDQSAERHVTIMMFVCFLGFIICFTPYFVLNIADPEMRRWPFIHGLSFIFIAASSVINPFIYVASNRSYRRAFLALLRRAANWTCNIT